MTEIGRQPWTVFGLLRTEDSVSPTVTSGDVLFSLISFSTIYLILLGVLIFLFVRTARRGPFADQVKKDDSDVDPYQSLEGGNQVVVE